ncbi:MAG: tetratricopeptide repeat protein [Nitrospinota bacterium]
MVEKIKAWFKGIIEKLLLWGKRSPAEEEVEVRSPQELKALAERIKEAIQHAPEDIKLHYDLGEVFMEMHRYGEAIPPLLEVVGKGPEHKSARLLLGRAQMEMGRDDDAVEHLTEAMRLDPQSEVVKKALCQAHSNLSTSYGRMKNQKQSEYHFHEAVKIIPNFGPAHLSMGICYSELGRYNDALAKIQEALNYDKNLTVQAHYNFGEVYSKLKNTKKAIKHYKEAISVDPVAAMPNLRLGMLYFKLKKYEDCIVPLRRAIKHSPKYGAEGYFKLGAALMKLKRFRIAEKPLRKAVELSPDNETANDALAENLFQISTDARYHGQPGEEIDILREVVYFNPEHINAHQRLSDAYDERRSGAKAITHCIITQRFLSEQKKLKELGESRAHLEELYKKYHTGPDEFKKVITPRKRYF